ncbi:MAG TPA: SpoIIE family protein phosphatase [bacterium]|nr:SpoIIE family protein phosphatase [bacterium]
MTTEGGPAVQDHDEAEAARRLLRDHGADILRLLQRAPIAVFGQDRSLRYTWVANPHPALGPEETVGRTDADLLPSEEAAVLTAVKRRVLETGTGERAEVWTTIRGRAHYYDIIVEPCRDDGGRVTGIVGAALEMTQRRQHLAEVEEARARAEHGQAHYREIATILQQSLLPSHLPDLPGGRLSAWYGSSVHESEVGGDWYDAFILPDGRVGLSIGDVVGRGLMAAVLMGEIRQAIRVAAMDAATVGAVMIRADHALRLGGREGFVTAVFGVLDARRHRFTYSTAGHPCPFVGSPDGTVTELPGRRFPLGLPYGAPHIDWSEWETPLPAGSLLVLYTDGLVEQTRDPERGRAMLQAAIREEIVVPGENPAGRIVRRVVGGRSLTDDVAVLTLRVEG